MTNIIDVIGEDLSVYRMANGLYTTKEHDSLIIWESSQTFTWFSRQIYYGNIAKWLEIYRNYTPEEVKDAVIDLPSEVNLSEIHHYESIDMRQLLCPKLSENNEYLQSRNITDITAKQFGLEESQDYIVIPIEDYNGERAGIICRYMYSDNKKEKYRKLFVKAIPPLWPIKHWRTLTPDKIVLVFEGAWSTMRFTQVLKFDDMVCFSLLGAQFNHDIINMLNGIKTVIFILDNDDTGQRLGEKVKELCPSWYCIKPSTYPDEMTDTQIIKFRDIIREKVTQYELIESKKIIGY